MKRFTIVMTLMLFVVLASTNAFAQLKGKIMVPGDYPTLAAAIADLNAKGVGEGGVSINLLPDNPVTVPAGGFSITTRSATDANPVTIEGNGNDLLDASRNLADVSIDQVFKTAGNSAIIIGGFSTKNARATKAAPMEKAELPNPVLPNK